MLFLFTPRFSSDGGVIIGGGNPGRDDGEVGELEHRRRHRPYTPSTIFNITLVPKKVLNKNKIEVEPEELPFSIESYLDSLNKEIRERAKEGFYNELLKEIKDELKQAVLDEDKKLQVQVDNQRALALWEESKKRLEQQLEDELIYFVMLLDEE